MASPKTSTRRKPKAAAAGLEKPLSPQCLTELALDLHWAWDHDTDELWSQLDPQLWASTHNPWVLVQAASSVKLESFLARPEIRRRVETLLEHTHQHRDETTWFKANVDKSAMGRIAYFSMEFALSEALPIYSGGLGNVAADQLKAACDLGVPVIGVGLLYQQGYFRQVIRADGTQDALFPYNDPGQLPITPVRDADGAWLHVEIALPGYPISFRVWQVQVHHRTLYLLDSNHAANMPAARAITSELYGGGPELRMQQEIALGIGGWRLLRALGMEPEVCHLNEGHAAFAVLERARCFAEDTGCSFSVALTATRAGNVFTTHTAVPAGFDRFAPQLVERYLTQYAVEELGITLHELMAMGRVNPDDPTEDFNMAYLAVRGSGAVSAVSRLHGDVSRRLFGPLYPRWPEREVPITHVTNGIHVPTWTSPAADAFWTKAVGHDCWRDPTGTSGQDVRRASDTDLWDLRIANRRTLVEYVRDSMPGALSWVGAPAKQIARVRKALDPTVLTLGFARRFTSYKRPTLLLQSPERLIRILSDPYRPVQLVIAGKAHPADGDGQMMIAEWTQFIRRPEVEGRVIFIPDYDLLLAEHLVQGVDLWINTPRRPWEASGTSGMKVLVNGGLNLSELDGWWAEAFAPEVGWALGDGWEHGDDAAWDAAEAEALYLLLEREIVPAFYERDDSGIPTKWVAKMRESMTRLTPHFSTNRVVREYAERYYMPAATRFRKRAADAGELATRLARWQRNLTEHWHEARFGSMRVESHDGQHRFHVEVWLGELDADAVRVELFAEPVDGAGDTRHDMARGDALSGGVVGHEYTACVASLRAATDYTARLVPHHLEASIPLEAPHILWQR